MDIRQEINDYANTEDKPILHWLLGEYFMSSQWHFVARCSFKRYGTQSYQTCRIWAPTKEGVILWNDAQSKQADIHTEQEVRP